MNVLYARARHLFWIPVEQITLSKTNKNRAFALVKKQIVETDISHLPTVYIGEFDCSKSAVLEYTVVYKNIFVVAVRRSPQFKTCRIALNNAVADDNIFATTRVRTFWTNCIVARAYMTVGNKYVMACVEVEAVVVKIA